MPLNYCSVPLKFPCNSDIVEFNKIAKRSSHEDYCMAFKFLHEWTHWIKRNVDISNEVYALVLRTLDGLKVRLHHAKDNKCFKQKYSPDDLSLHFYNTTLKQATFEQINEVRISLCVFLEDMYKYELENGTLDLLKIIKSRLYTFANHQLRVHISPDDAVRKSNKISIRCQNKYEIEHGSLKIVNGKKNGGAKSNSSVIKNIKNLLTELKDKL
jgi:hypothetical protein